MYVGKEEQQGSEQHIVCYILVKKKETIQIHIFAYTSLKKHWRNIQETNKKNYQKRYGK